MKKEFSILGSRLSVFVLGTLFSIAFSTVASAVADTVVSTAAAAQASDCALADKAAPLYTMEHTIGYHELENGLQIRILPLSGSGTLAISSQFSVGSGNETAGQSGYAHLFEHMLFKGSEHAPGDKYVQTMSALSGRFNATTFFDYTNYFLTIPAPALELSLWLEADRFIRPRLSDETVKNQQNAVLEEMATSIDNRPYVRKAMAFLLAQVEGTPYGHAVIGTAEDVRQATPAALSQFHQRFYRPDSMQLSLVGDVPAQTLEWVEHNFSGWPRPAAAPPRIRALNITPKPVHGEITDDRGPWPAVLLAWHTVGQTHKDAPAVRLLESYLFHNAGSLIRRSSLRNPDQLLSFSIPLTMEHHGVTNLVLVPRARTSLDTLVANVESLLGPLTDNKISATELCRLKHVWLDKALAKLDNNQALAIALSATQARDTLAPLTGPWERINAVTVDDIHAVAQHYFSDNYVRLDLLPPWYIRAAKTLLEWLPQDMADSIEEGVL